ncbi:MAG: RNA polymerase sigma factor [Opitutaceae bacterium]|nr:RNA polymerase sigma factor [Opitutaceae bacterium]
MPQSPEHNFRLVRAAREGDPRAWDVLLRERQLPLFAYVVELTRDREAARDIVQETFAGAVRHIETLRDEARFASWLFGIAHQKCVQHFRRSRRHDERFAAPEALPEDHVDVAAEDPRDRLLREEHAGEFFALLEKLPPDQRSALLLHVLEEFSLEEIASITAVPTGTVKSRLYHARRALRLLVEETL